jgi:hypothetical protein
VYTWKLAGEPDRCCTFTAEVNVGHHLTLQQQQPSILFPSKLG